MSRLAWPSLVLTVLLSACTAGRPSAPLSPQSVASTPDGVLVVFVRKFSYAPYTDSASDSIVNCIEKEIGAGQTGRRFVAYEEFRRLAFPDIEPQSAPRDPEYLKILLEDPKFRERIKPLAIRFLVFVGGVTKAAPTGGAAIAGCCAGGVLIAYVQWDKATDLGATVLDLTHQVSVTKLEASASGTAWLLIVEVVPIGAPAETESQSCHQLGKRLAADLAERQAVYPQ